MTTAVEIFCPACGHTWDADCYLHEDDVDTLLARHNALVEAVKWERECEDVAHWRYEVWVMAEVGSGDCEIYTVAQCIHHAARAEVDRILSEEK